METQVLIPKGFGVELFRRGLVMTLLSLATVVGLSLLLVACAGTGPIQDKNDPPCHRTYEPDGPCKPRDWKLKVNDDWFSVSKSQWEACDIGEQYPECYQE